MNSRLFEQIENRIKNENIRFGSCNVTFTFHDGRITKWNFSFSEMHNVPNSKSISQNKEGEAYEY